MLKLTIEIEAKTQFGLEHSVKEALRVIAKGNRTGFDSNGDENYKFEIDGEEEPEEDNEDNDDWGF